MRQTEVRAQKFVRRLSFSLLLGQLRGVQIPEDGEFPEKEQQKEQQRMGRWLLVTASITEQLSGG